MFSVLGANYYRNAEERTGGISVWCDTENDNLWPFSWKSKKKNYLHLCINRYKIITYFHKGNTPQTKCGLFLIHVSSVTSKGSLELPTHTLVSGLSEEICLHFCQLSCCWR
jgi:hypothetical protein